MKASKFILLVSVAPFLAPLSTDKSHLQHLCTATYNCGRPAPTSVEGNLERRKRQFEDIISNSSSAGQFVRPTKKKTKWKVFFFLFSIQNYLGHKVKCLVSFVSCQLETLRRLGLIVNVSSCTSKWLDDGGAIRSRFYFGLTISILCCLMLSRLTKTIPTLAHKNTQQRGKKREERRIKK